MVMRKKDRVATVVVQESVRRMVRDVEFDIEAGLIDIPVDCPLEAQMGYEQLKRLAALNIVMTRIFQTLSMN